MPGQCEQLNALVAGMLESREGAQSSIEGCSAASLLACLALDHQAIPDFASPLPAYLALDATGILELIVLHVGRCNGLYHQMSGSC